MSDVVTVVVPTRNRATVVATTLAAILSQREVDVRLVVIDEGSTDGTPLLLQHIAAAEPVRVVRNDTARGLPAARNQGTAHADTEWIAYCDDDDVWAPDKLRAQLDATRLTGAGWSCTGSVLVDEGLRVVGHQRVDPTIDIAAALQRANVVPAGGSGVLARRSLVEDAGGFDESLPSSEDWDLWIRLAARAELAVVDRPLVAYRLWRNSMSTHVARMRATRATVLGRTGAERDAAHEHAYGEFLAHQLAAGGHRGPAAAAYARLGIEHRRPKDLVRAAAVLVSPGAFVRAGEARAVARIPREWLEEVDGWLPHWRTEGAAVGSRP